MQFCRTIYRIIGYAIYKYITHISSFEDKIAQLQIYGIFFIAFYNFNILLQIVKHIPHTNEKITQILIASLCKLHKIVRWVFYTWCCN